jgi:predicted HTH transcriptional regulator
LRESIANAVAHSFYPKEQGDIVIEMFPNRIVISNNCSLDAELFIDKWFSRIHSTQNKLLMHIMRISKLTDELGSGKNRIFRHMIEHGKREPIIEFEPFKTHGCWKTTLYNEDTNIAILNLINRLKQYFKNPDE